MLTSHELLTNVAIMPHHKFPELEQDGKCAICGRRGPVIRLRVGSLDTDVSRQVPLCRVHRAAPLALLALVPEANTYMPDDRCVNCGTTAPPIGRHFVERVKAGRAPTMYRSMYLCQPCALPIVSILVSVPQQRTYDPMPTVGSMAELKPSPAIYAQTHGGRRPPKNWRGWGEQ